MPKEGYGSVTLPQEFIETIDAFNEREDTNFSSKQEALQTAWNFFEKKHYGGIEPEVNIDGKIVGPKHPIYIIGEIGINHNGDLDTCKKLIDMASDAGCDAVKFQKRTLDIVYSKKDLEKPRSVPISILEGALRRDAFDKKDTSRIKGLIERARNSTEIVVKTKDQKRMLEFGKKDYDEINEYCKKKNISWFASPWDIPSVDFLEQFDVPCYKIASSCLTDKDLLIKVKETGKPIILSTGMSNQSQIKKAVKLIGQENLVLLGCTSTYPTLDLSDQNLRTLETLRMHYDCPIGYSGHEPDTFPTLLAMALGATMIERHITLGRTMYGSDQASSLERKGLELICRHARDIPLLLGDGVKKVLKSEEPIIPKLRRNDTL